MPIVKLKKYDRFVVADSKSIELIKEPVALAIWIYLLDKPEDWIVRYADIQNRFDIGKKKVSSAMKHLMNAGLVDFVKAQSESGQLCGTEITVYAYSRGVKNGSLGDSTEESILGESVKPRVGKMTSIVNKDLLLNKELLINTECAFNFRAELKKLGVQEPHLSDWLKVRKNKKATNTKTSLSNFLAEAHKARLSPDRAVFTCAAEGWAGLKANWLTKAKNGQSVGFIEKHTDRSWAEGL